MYLLSATVTPNCEQCQSVTAVPCITGETFVFTSTPFYLLVSNRRLVNFSMVFLFCTNKHNFFQHRPESETILIAGRSMAWVCGSSLAGIAGSNPARGMDVCLVGVLFAFT